MVPIAISDEFIQHLMVRIWGISMRLNVAIAAECLVISLVCWGCAIPGSGTPIEGLPVANKTTIANYVIGHRIYSRTEDWEFAQDGSLTQTRHGEKTEGEYKFNDGELCLHTFKKSGRLIYYCWRIYEKGQVLVVDSHLVDGTREGEGWVAMRGDAPCQSAFQTAHPVELATKQQIINAFVGHSIALRWGEHVSLDETGHFISTRQGVSRHGNFQIDDGQLMLEYYDGGGHCVALVTDGVHLVRVEDSGYRAQLASE